jgi:rod shape-determining protein MreD
MKNRYLILIAVVNFILTSTILQLFRVDGILFNTALILTVTITATLTSREGYVFAIAAGALQDVFLGKVLAVNIICYVVIVFVINMFEHSLFEENILTPSFMLLLATLVYNAIYLPVMHLFGLQLPFEMIYGIVIKETIYNILVGIIMHQIFYSRFRITISR